MYIPIPSVTRNALTLLLAGGQGERLYPLTKDRSKPSVPFAGSFRIIDFTLSNCINSGLRRVYVLIQYKSQSLNRHLRDGWSILSRELNEFIESVPPQKRSSSSWYEGTSDAIYQNIYLLEQIRPERVLILSGDHIYRMDYRFLLEFHVQKQADVTIACIEFPRREAQPFGVMQIDNEGRVLHFVEKPGDPPPVPGKPDTSLINMGVYVFKTEELVRAVIDDSKDPNSAHDLGKNVLPRLVDRKDMNVFAYSFSRQTPNPYWRDVGDIKSYYNANMELLSEQSSINLFAEDWPFRSDTRHLVPSQFDLGGQSPDSVHRSYISAGCIVNGKVDRCILSPNVKIQRGSSLEGCIVFNESTIGRDCRIRNTIVDKHVRIPDGCVIGYHPDIDRKQFLLTEDNIVIIPKGMMVERHEIS